MIDRIHIQNVKAHRDTEISLGRLTVLVGPNGVGKTSVLQALEVMCRLAHEPWDAVFHGELAWEALQRRHVDDDASIKISRIASRSNVPLEISRFEPGAKVPWAFRITARRDNVQPRGFMDVHFGDRHEIRDISTHPRSRLMLPDDVIAELGVAQLLRLESGHLAAPSYTGEAAPRLGQNGEGLADVIATMLLSDPERAASLQDALRKVIPEISRFRIERTSLSKTTRRILRVDDQPIPMDEAQTFIGNELIFDVGQSKGIPAHAMSEGSLVALGILTALWSPTQPRLALLDGLERSLHPTAQWELLAQLRRILEEFPDLQIVATTHSPDLVDRLAPEEVVVMSLDSAGASRARPLTECPRKDMLEVLGAGELWSSLEKVAR